MDFFNVNNVVGCLTTILYSYMVDAVYDVMDFLNINNVFGCLTTIFYSCMVDAVSGS